MALAGGALVMHQVGLFSRPWNGPLGAVFFGVSALLAAIAPMELTEGITEGKECASR